MVPMAWFVLGVALICLEFLVPTFYLIWFGLGALVAAGSVAIVTNLPWIGQVMVWGVVTVVLVAIWQSRITRRSLPIVTSGSPKRDALTVVAISPIGLVRFSSPIYISKVWRVTSNTRLMRGDRVRLLGIENGKLKVEVEGSNPTG